MNAVRRLPAQGASVPVSIKGWNAYNALDNMPPDCAVILDNIFPETSYLRLRRGSVVFCDTGETDAVQTLFDYAGGGTEKLLAAAGGKIFDVTSGTASTLDTGYTSDVWGFSNFATGGGTFLLAANGVDVPWKYDGSSIAALTITGVTDTTLTCPLAFAKRMFYVETGTLSVWYTTAGAYEGALTEFDFGSLCSRGGEIATIGTWTRDNGYEGAQDLFVVVTTQGEILVYNGVDPSSSTDWALVGRFVLGKPVNGIRSLCRTGPDMILLCEDGFQPLSAYLVLGNTKANEISISERIGNAVSDAVQRFGTLPGWQAVVYPQGTCIIVNAPISTTQFYQFVVNTVTGSWCRFKGMDALCWSVFGSKPYFGGAAGKVYRYDIGTSDSGVDIVGEWLAAYQYFGGRGMLKRFMMARPVMQVSGSLNYTLDVQVDFTPNASLQTVSSNVSGAGVWGAPTKWGQFNWGASNASTLQRNWKSVSGIGYAGAVHLKISTSTISVNINSIDLLFERGSFI